MKYTKKVIGALEKCYALSQVTVQGRECLLVAAEKHAPCQRFDLEGNLLDTVWEEPGGVMTMVPMPDRENMFLATHKFYSPNDSKEAMLVTASWEDGQWRITKLCDLPFVHRFDIFAKNGVNYLLACALKSGHEYKDDWRFPGTVYAGILPDDPRKGKVELRPVMEGLLRNHGYTRCSGGSGDRAVISCQSGVYLFTPPEELDGDWQIEQLIDEPTSDALLVDLDEDGIPELFTMGPFHGDQISIYRRENGRYQKVFDYPEKTPFLHAICAGEFYGTPVAVCGNREDKRELLCFLYDRENARYRWEQIDQGSGPANCLIFYRAGKPVILAANRETDEIAMYEVERD